MEAKKVLSAVVCHECGGYFTPSGLRMHSGSEKCRLAKLAKPLKEQCETEYASMKAQRKAVVVKNVALAISRRDLQGMCGLELAKTKLMHTDLECEILDQHWVHEWVYLVWKHYNKAGYTRAAYKKLEELKAMTIPDRESEIGLLMLNIYG
jgi:hypothetical protein